MSKTALVIGATGLTGSELINLLIADSEFDSIKIFGRKSLDLKHPKITEYIVDLFTPKSFENDFKGDVVFCCIGTTAKKTPDKNLYRKIDFGIPVALAELCTKNSIPHLLIISALGANSNSSVFYSRTKGEMQDAVQSMALEKIHLLQPSLIVGDRNDFRIGEKVASVIMKVAQIFMVGSLRKYRPIQALQIAQAMVHLSKFPTSDVMIESDEIQIRAAGYQPN